MKDDELLDIWEQVQRIMIALQDHIIPGVEMKSGVEDAVLVELLRRDTLLQPIPQGRRRQHCASRRASQAR